MLRKIEGKNFKLKKKLKTQAKNSKLKGKTQGQGGTRLSPLPKWCYKKKPALRPLCKDTQLFHVHTTRLHSRVVSSSRTRW